MPDQKLVLTIYIGRSLTSDEIERVHVAAVDALPSDADPSVSSAIVSLGREGDQDA
jgi:hypothetical protein